MTYLVELTLSARKDVLALADDVYARVETAINKLQANPHPQNSRKMRGSADAWRLRVGDYRVVYRIDDRARTVSVYRVQHRRDVYRQRGR